MQNTPVKTTADLYRDALEAERQRQEKNRNRGRFARYNARRVNAGLPRLSEVDQAAREHGLDQAQEKLRSLTSSNAVQPQHRDNIHLLTR